MAQVNETTATQVALGLTIIALGAVLQARRRTEPAPRTQRSAGTALSPTRLQESPPAVVAAKRLNRAAGVLALSVLADSAIEHYRGSFENKAMFTPLIVSALTLGTSIHGTADRRGAAHTIRDTT